MTDKQRVQQDYPPNYQPYEDEINLIDYFRVLWKWKWLIVAGTLICAIVVMGITMVRYPTTDVTECTISLNFPGIEKHNNPDGTLFEKGQIITPAILNEASAFLRKKDRGFPLKDLRGMIAIEAVIPPEVQERIQAAKKKKASYSFFASQYRLILSTQQNGVFLKREKNQLLLSIVDEYRKSFEKNYGEEPLVAINFPADFLATSDYLDAVNTFKVKTVSFIEFLNSKIEDAGFFRSQKTGASFVDIKDNFKLLNDIIIAESEATINTLKLTKNKEGLINVYKHKIRSIDTKRKKKASEALIARNLLKETNQTNRYGFSTSKGGGGETGTNLVLDSSFIKNLIDEDSSMLLLKTALNAEIEAKNLAVDKEFLEEEIALLRQKEKEKEKEKEEIAYVETALKNIESKIVILSKSASELNKEYLHNLIDNAVQVVQDPKTSTTREKSLKQITLLAGVVALFMFVFLAFFIEYIRNASKEK